MREAFGAKPVKPGSETARGQNRHRLFDRAVLFLLLGWCCFNWCSTAIHVVRYYNPLPVSDYWRVIEDVPLIQTGDFSWLWRQHNEHRILFPEIVFALDHLLFAGRQILPVVISSCCYIGAIFILGRKFWCDANTSITLKTQALVLGGVITGWPLSVYVLGTPFLLPWTLLQLAVVLALASAVRFAENSGPHWLAICITSAVVATYSVANGVLLWPILLTVAVLLHAPRSRLIALAVAAAISVGVFFVGYQRPGVPLLASIQHPVYSIGFVLSYFSMPFGALRQPAFGLAFGLVSLTLWATCIARNFRRPRRASPFFVVASGYFGFLLLTAGLTSVARVNLADSGFGNAKATRYLTFPLLGWAVLVAFTLALAYRPRWRTFSTRVILVGAMIVVGFMQIRLGRWLRINDSYVAFQQWAAISLQNDVYDTAFLGSVFPEEAFIEHFLPLLRKGHKSIFADPVVETIGRDFRSLFHLAKSEREAGGVLRITPVKEGVSVVGWAANLDRGGRDTVLLVDGLGEIVGFGRHLRAGVPQQLRSLPAKTSQTWVGFINRQYGSSSFAPYIVDLKAKIASPFAHSIKIPAESGTDPQL
ncbi:MAG: hypothetical protein ACJ74Y_05370 [Bryobacteraceae bacterium]